MAGGCREWVRADDAQRVGNMGSYYFLSPKPMWRPLSNKQQPIFCLFISYISAILTYITYAQNPGKLCLQKFQKCSIKSVPLT